MSKAPTIQQENLDNLNFNIFVQNEEQSAASRKILNAGLTKQDVLATTATLAQGSEATPTKPAIPSPYLPTHDYNWGTGANSLCILAEQMGKLGCRATLDAWQSEYKRETGLIHENLSLAPSVGAAIIKKGETDADQTSNEASMAKWDGAIQLAAFGASGLMGAYGVYTETSESAVATKDVPGAGAGPSGINGGAGAAADADAAVDQEVADEAETDTYANVAKQSVPEDTKLASSTQRDAVNMDGSALTAASTGGSGAGAEADAAASKGGTFMKKIYEGFLKATQNSVMFKMLADGMQGLAVDSKYKAIISHDQLVSAQFDAMDKELQMFGGFLSAEGSRVGEMRGMTAQNFSNMLNIWGKEVDGLTSALASFRG